MRLASLVLLTLAGCATYEKVSWESGLGSWDGRLIQMTGIPVFSDIDASLLYVCPNGHIGGANERCIDVIAAVSLVDKLRNSRAKCADIYGKFVAFGPARVGSGYLRSSIGLIEAAQAIPCGGR